MANAPEPPRPDAAPEPPSLTPAEFYRLIGPAFLTHFEAAAAARPPADRRDPAETLDALFGSQRVAASRQPADMFQSMARAYVAWVTGGFRFWGRVIEASADAVTSAMEGLTDAAERPGRPAGTDRLDDMLARLADLPDHESARLRGELLRWLSSSEAEAGAWRRRHKAKP